MRPLLIIAFILFSTSLLSQSYEEEMIEYRKEVNKEFKDESKSPLSEKDRMKFKELPFFPIDEDYKVSAKIERVKNAKSFEMKTTTDRLPIYKAFAKAYFEIDGKSLELTIYQNQKLIEKEEYKDYLFLPFTDYTNGNESYGGGRYIDLEKTDGDTIIIDFNKSYNPYCAYNKKYSCPIPPEENSLPLEIKAGVKYNE